ncbi:C4-dicarboxylate ABC transporter substrate-binding protein, partial [Oxalobacteraceae bacterium OM1]
IKGKRINVGPVGSGTALSATTLYRLMFGKALPEANASYLSNEEALSRLAIDKSLDVVVIVAGQPAKLFTDMKPEARIKFLRLDPAARESARAVHAYFPATIRSRSYPNLLKHDVPTLTVKALLVTYDDKLESTREALTQFATALCDRFDYLQEAGHPKWKEVKMTLPPLGRRWKYYAPMERVLRSCSAAPAVKHDFALAPAVHSARTCGQSDKVLGLCSAP